MALEFPEDFPKEDELGWYSLKVLGRLYKEGRCTIEGWDYLAEREERKRKLAEEKLIKLEKIRIDKEEQTARDKSLLIELLEDEKNRKAVIEGMTFSSKHLLEAAFIGLFDISYTQKLVKELIKEHIEVEYVKLEDASHKVYRVIKVHKEGARKWPTERYWRRDKYGYLITERSSWRRIGNV